MGKVTGSKISRFPNGVGTDRDGALNLTFLATTTGAITQYLSVPYKLEVQEVQWVGHTALAAAASTDITFAIGSAGATIATLTLSTASAVAGSLQKNETITAPAVASGETIRIVRPAHGTALVGTASIIYKRVD